MKKFAFLVMVLVLAFGMSAFAGDAVKGTLNLKVGDEVYACGCGKGCDCLTISNKPGKCTCDKDLVKAKVEKVGKGTADLKLASGEVQTFKTTGKYACNCGKGCDCLTISQKPGKCSCNKDMVKVGKKSEKKAAAPPAAPKEEKKP